MLPLQKERIQIISIIAGLFFIIIWFDQQNLQIEFIFKNKY